MADRPDDIVVYLDDGRTARFPAGTKPEVIETTLQRIAPGVERTVLAAEPGNRSQTPSNTPAAPRAADPGAPSVRKALTDSRELGRLLRGPAPQGLADSFLARMARGTAISRLDPLAELAARGAESAGLNVPGAGVADVQAMNAERRDIQAGSRERVGDTGLDNAGTAGTMVLDTLLLNGMFRGLGKPHLARPDSLKDLAKAGAVAGGVTAGMSPVEDSARMSTPELLFEKAKQTGVGVPVGMVAAPLASIGLTKAAEGIGAGLRGVRDWARSTIAPNSALRTSQNDAQLEKFLGDQAASVNVEWARVPEAVKQSLRDATRRATSVSGTLPAEAVKNRLLAESEGLPQLTLGQATRDPMQFSREANSPEEQLRNYFGNQRNSATQRLGSIADSFGPPRTPYALGDELAGEVGRQAATRRSTISSMYDEFKGDAAGYHKLTNTPDFVRSALSELKTQQQFNDLPKTFRDQLMALERQGGTLSIRDAAQLWKNINSYYSNTQGTPAGAALGTLKAEAAKLLDGATFAGTKRGAEVIEKFRAANAERRLMGQWEESSSAIKELAKRNPRVAQEAVFDKYVMRGSVNDFTGFWKTLPADLRLGVKRRFVEEVSEKAMNAYGSQATATSTAVKLLREYPKEKLDLMFSPSELKSLRNTLEYLRLTTEAPAGSFVNRSNSLVDLKDFLSDTRNVPLLGPGLSRPLRAMIDEDEARLALDPARLDTPLAPIEVPRGVQSLVRRSPTVVAPQTIPTLQEVARPNQEE